MFYLTILKWFYKDFFKLEIFEKILYCFYGNCLFPILRSFSTRSNPTLSNLRTAYRHSVRVKSNSDSIKKINNR